MSYPVARYLKDTGEISATFRPASAEPDLMSESFRTEGPTVVGGNRVPLPGHQPFHPG